MSHVIIFFISLYQCESMYWFSLSMAFERKMIDTVSSPNIESIHPKLFHTTRSLYKGYSNQKLHDISKVIRITEYLNPVLDIS